MSPQRIQTAVTSGEEIDWVEVAISSGAGMLSGALATVGAPPVANVMIQLAGNAVISAGESFAIQAIDGGVENVDYSRVAFDSAIGGLTSVGNGLSKGVSKHLMTQGVMATKQVANKGILKAAKYYFSQTATLFYKPIGRDAIGDIFGAFLRPNATITHLIGE